MLNKKNDQSIYATLSNENINHLLRIILEGEEIQNFNFDQAHKHWVNEKTRLINLKNS